MIYTIEELKAIIEPIAKEYGINELYIFSSYARGDAAEDCDVDIIFRRIGSNIEGIEVGGLYEDLCESIDKKIHLLTLETLDQKRLIEQRPKFIEKVRTEMVRIL